MNPPYAACILFVLRILRAVMPRWVRRDVLFGVTTQAEFRATAETRTLLNRYSTDVLILTLGCSLLAMCAAWLPSPRGSVAAQALLRYRYISARVPQKR